MGKRLTECDIPNEETSYHPRLPHPLPYGAIRTALRQMILRIRCAVVRTYMLHLHHSKETAPYSTALYLVC